MISITLPAMLIPDDQVVRKVAGVKQYVFKKEIKIWGAENKIVTPEPGVAFLIAEGNICCVPGTQNLSIDFETPTDAIEFLENLRTHQ
jgi:hypothetical protein